MSNQNANQWICTAAWQNQIKSQQHPRQIHGLESSSKPEIDYHFFVELTPNIQNWQNYWVHQKLHQYEKNSIKIMHFYFLVEKRNWTKSESLSNWRIFILSDLQVSWTTIQWQRNRPSWTLTKRNSHPDSIWSDPFPIEVNNYRGSNSSTWSEILFLGLSGSRKCWKLNEKSLLQLMKLLIQRSNHKTLTRWSNAKIGICNTQNMGLNKAILQPTVQSVPINWCQA